MAAVTEIVKCCLVVVRLKRTLRTVLTHVGVRSVCQLIPCR
jgi:hypothetical protein